MPTNSLLALYNVRVTAARAVDKETDPVKRLELRGEYRRLNQEFEATANRLRDLIPEEARSLAQFRWPDAGNIWFFIDTVFHYANNDKCVVFEIEFCHFEFYDLRDYDDFVAKIQALGEAWKEVVEIQGYNKLTDRAQALFFPAEFSQQPEEKHTPPT
ncbi:MAG: hypothetical protein NUV56_04570 [Candidatus Uhrbacteria bacterium]|nr:hypothetical protein [Candidatus Uhrbacteria bacterium]